MQSAWLRDRYEKQLTDAECEQLVARLDECRQAESKS